MLLVGRIWMVLGVRRIWGAVDFERGQAGEIVDSLTAFAY